MDTNDLITQARARFEHGVAKRVLKEKYQAKMIFAYRGGMWRAGADLCNALVNLGGNQEIVLPDLYETPVKINSQELLQMSLQRFHEQMNAWLLEFESLSKNR